MSKTYRGDDKKRLKDKYKLERERRNKRKIIDSKPESKRDKNERN